MPTDVYGSATGGGGDWLLAKDGGTNLPTFSGSLATAAPVSAAANAVGKTSAASSLLGGLSGAAGGIASLAGGVMTGGLSTIAQAAMGAATAEAQAGATSGAQGGQIRADNSTFGNFTKNADSGFMSGSSSAAPLGVPSWVWIAGAVVVLAPVLIRTLSAIRPPAR